MSSHTETNNNGQNEPGPQQNANPVVNTEPQPPMSTPASNQRYVRRTESEIFADFQDYYVYGRRGTNQQHPPEVEPSPPYFNQTTWKHMETALIYMFFHVTMFVALIIGGFTCLQICNVLLGPEQTLFLSPAAYFVLLQILLVVKCILDYFQYMIVQPNIEENFQDSKVLKHVPFTVGSLLLVLAYFAIFKQFYTKYFLIESGQVFEQERSILFLLAVFYVFYYNVTLCLNDSRHTKLIYHIASNVFHTKLGWIASQFGQSSALLLLFQDVFITRFMIYFIGCIIGFSVLYTLFYHLIMAKISKKSGVLFTEMVWALLTAKLLIRSYLYIGNQSETFEEHNYIYGTHFIQFHGGIAFSISLTTRLFISHFLIEPPWTREQMTSTLPDFDNN